MWTDALFGWVGDGIVCMDVCEFLNTVRASDSGAWNFGDNGGGVGGWRDRGPLKMRERRLGGGTDGFANVSS